MRDPGVRAVRAARWPERARGFGAELCPNLGDGGRSGGVTLLGRDDLDAVGKSDTGDDLRQLICSLSAPGFRGGADELEHH